MKNFEIYFENSNETFYCEEGKLISEICEESGHPLDLVCGGEGKCGKCLVKIKRNGLIEDVLACKTVVDSDITLYLKKREKLNILEEGKSVTEFIPHIIKKYIEVKEIDETECGFFSEWIEKKLKLKFNFDSIRSLQKVITDDDTEGFTLIIKESDIIGVEAGNTENINYGIALDIGTTTVVMYLYDMISGRFLKSYSAINGQVSLGGDVISRISYCTENPEGTEKMKEKIASTVNTLIEDAENEFKNLKNNIYEIIACGNSTMSHLFHGLNPKSLGYYPFMGIHKGNIMSNAKSLGIDVSPFCRIDFLPLIGGFVGADTLSVLLAVEADDKVRLIIDLGTNGEIAVGNSSRYFAASTACGPALEGAGIKCGMRGAHGAIESFKIIDEDILYEVIGKEKAIGICGSGIVDIVAELLENGIITENGKFLSKEEFEDKYPGNRLSQRLFKDGRLNCFSIEEDVVISQKDVRQIQLAKSAIYTGCNMIMEKYGEAVQEILLSGAFGSYINVKNAERIGLIPKIENVNTKSIGNGAGTGVRKYLLNRNEKKTCQHILERVVHLDLASEVDFQDNYIRNMNF